MIMVERYIRSVYCEDAFLKKMGDFYESVSSDGSPIALIWNSIKNLLFSGDVRIFLDLGKDEFICRTDDIYKRRKKAAKRDIPFHLPKYEHFIYDLYISSIDGSVRIHFDKPLKDIDFCQASDGQLNAIYLTCENLAKCKDIELRYGVLVISPENLSDLYKTLLDDGAAVLKGRIGGWKSILSGKFLPCNSAVLIDNYLLSSKDHIDENLGEILDSFLPPKLDIPFQISIICMLKNNGFDSSGTDRYESVRAIIERIRPNLIYKLLLYKVSGVFHDRILITNSTFVSSGAGFNLFESQKIKNDTSISILFPYLSNHVKWLNNAYSNIINRVKYIDQTHEEYKDDSYPFRLGEGHTRLAEL